MKKHSITFIISFFVATCIYAQNGNETINISQAFFDKVQQESNSAKNAADQKTNFKSIVTDLIGGRYYQALIKNGILNQQDGEIQIKSTIYGLIRLFDSSRKEQKYFEKLRWARNIQIGAGTSLSNDNKINVFKSSLTLALINKREYRDKDNLFGENNITGKAIAQSINLLDKIDKQVDADFNDKQLTAEKKQELVAKYQALNDKFNNSNFDFSLLKDFLTDAEINELTKKWKDLTDKYDRIQKNLSGAPLLTFAYEGNYKNNKWQNINTRVEFLKGFGNKTDSVRKYDFYSGLFYNIERDSIASKNLLNRNIFTIKLGVNTVVWRNKDDGSSIIEVFGGAEFQNISQGMYVEEKKNAFKLDVTLSFRLMKNLYLPFQVKYNAATGRFEGYLDLKFDVVNIFK